MRYYTSDSQTRFPCSFVYFMWIHFFPISIYFIRTTPTIAHVYRFQVIKACCSVCEGYTRRPLLHTSGFAWGESWMHDHSGTLLFPFASSLLLCSSFLFWALTPLLPVLLHLNLDLQLYSSLPLSCNLPIRNSLGLAQSYELELLSPPNKVKAISIQYDVGIVTTETIDWSQVTRSRVREVGLVILLLYQNAFGKVLSELEQIERLLVKN